METRAPEGEAPAAFGQRSGARRSRTPSSPCGSLDEGPTGGDSAYDNTWSFGELGPGERRTVEWKLTPVRPGTYTVGYRLAPALVGSAGVEGEDTAGEFEVTISDEPVPASDDEARERRLVLGELADEPARGRQQRVEVLRGLARLRLLALVLRREALDDVLERAAGLLVERVEDLVEVDDRRRRVRAQHGAVVELGRVARALASAM